MKRLLVLLVLVAILWQALPVFAVFLGPGNWEAETYGSFTGTWGNGTSGFQVFKNTTSLTASMGIDFSDNICQVVVFATSTAAAGFNITVPFTGLTANVVGNSAMDYGYVFDTSSLNADFQIRLQLNGAGALQVDRFWAIECPSVFPSHTPVPTATAIATTTPVPTVPTATILPSSTPAPTWTHAPYMTVVPTATILPSSTPGVPTATRIASSTPAPTWTHAPYMTVVPTATILPSSTPGVPTATILPSSTPGVPTATILPSSTPMNTPVDTPTEINTPVDTPTALPVDALLTLIAGLTPVTPTPSDTPTITPTPTETFTPTPGPWLYMTMSTGQLTRFDYTATASDVQIATLLALLLFSIWGFFLTAAFIWWRQNQ